jgi:hypothetical protein
MFAQSKSNASSFELNSNQLTKFEYATEIPKSYQSKLPFFKWKKTPFGNERWFRQYGDG